MQKIVLGKNWIFLTILLHGSCIWLLPKPKLSLVRKTYGNVWRKLQHFTRKDANKEKCSVWGVLSNATTWKFIYIDEDGKLWRSNDFLLNIRSYKEDQILPIYQFLYYIVKCCFEACTPTPSPNSSIVKLNE